MSSGFIMFALACSQAFLPVDRAAELKRTERRIFEDKRFDIVIEPAGMERPLDAEAATTLVQRCRSVGALYLTVRGGSALDEDVRAALESSCRKSGVTFQVRDEAAYGRRPGEPGFRTSRDVIATLVRTAARGLNLPVEIRPEASGEFPSDAAEILRGVGDWMKVNGESICCTTAGLYGDGRDVVSTRIESVDFLHFTDPGKTEFEFETGRRYVEARCLDARGSARLEKTAKGYRVTVTRPEGDDRVAVVKLLPALDVPFASRSFCVTTPRPGDEVGRFCAFIRDRLAKDGFDTLFLRVDYRYRYASHPECIGTNALSAAEFRRIADACRAGGIRLVPHVNTFGHQTGRGYISQFLVAYPDADEAPGKPVFEDYYRSFCPRHPVAMPVMLDLAEELMKAAGTDEFHIGCDEIFEIGTCARCRGTPTAKLLSEWVNGMNRGLKARGMRRLYIWADRLIPYVAERYNDSVYGESANGTADALGEIDRDVVLCDWHYGWRFDYPSVDAFRRAGYRTIISTWTDVAAAEKFAGYAARQGGDSVIGMMFTAWSGCADTMDAIEGRRTKSEVANQVAEVYRAYFVR